MKSIKIFSSIAASVASLFVYSTASAQGLIPPPIANLPGSSGNTATGVVTQYLNLFLAIVGIVTVAFLIYGGFRYITSAGNEETAEQAKKIITNSIIGLIVIILSYIIVTVIVNALAYQRV
jgi:cytochrome bd-type quinol oxidase subunit 2